jgi:hypothetical protein
MLRQKKRVKSTCLTSGIQDHDGDDIDNMLIHQLYTIYIMRRDEAKIIIEMLAGYPVISIGAVIMCYGRKSASKVDVHHIRNSGS